MAIERLGAIDQRTRRWGHVARRWGAAAVVGALSVSAYTCASAGSALAAPGKTPAPASPAASSAGRAAPIGSPQSIGADVLVVHTELLTAFNGSQTRGRVTCPGVMQPASGGAEISSTSLGTNINSSFPDGSAWVVDMNNASAVDNIFVVYALCVKPSSGYSVVSTVVAVPKGNQVMGVATCPAHRVVFGGGALSSSPSTLINVNTTTPINENGWEVDMNDAATIDSDFTVFAVCGKKPAGYTVVKGSFMPNPALTESGALASCPAGSPVVLGGGGIGDSVRLSDNLDGSFPVSGGWGIFANNGSLDDARVSAQAICVT